MTVIRSPTLSTVKPAPPFLTHTILTTKESCSVEVSRILRVDSAKALVPCVEERKEAHTIEVQQLDSIALTFEPLRFPTSASQNGEDDSHFSTLQVAQLHRFATETDPAFESRIHFLQTAWALLLRSYTREDIVSFALVEQETLQENYEKAITCRFGDYDHKPVFSSREISTHVILEKQLNTAMKVSFKQTKRQEKHFAVS